MIDKNKILKTLRDHKDLLHRYGVKDIGLFGSYSKGLQKAGSDIDILVDFYSEHETFDNLMAVCDLLENAFRNYKVEVVTKNGLSKYIGTHILKQTEYI